MPPLQELHTGIIKIHRPTSKTYAENRKLEGAIKQQSANEALRSDMANMQKAFTTLSEEFEEARKQVEDVEKLFEQGTDGRDMSVGERAIENPEYIEEVLNTGTTELFRCFEKLTGAPLEIKMHKQSMLSVLMGIATVLLPSCSQVPKTLEIFTETG